MAEELVVLITASSPDEAQMIGTALVAEHLAACVNIVPQVRSVFGEPGSATSARALHPIS